MRLIDFRDNKYSHENKSLYRRQHEVVAIQKKKAGPRTLDKKITGPYQAHLCGPFEPLNMQRDSWPALRRIALFQEKLWKWETDR